MQIKGILSFPNLFTPKVPQAGGDAKYGVSILLPPNDPQVQVIAAEVNKAALDTFPSGMPHKADVCFGLYDERYRGKEYYNPKFTGWYVFSCSAKQEDKPPVVNMSLQPIIDPAKVFAGVVAYVNANISGYTKGTGGVGGWLNGVAITDEEPPMGRLDNKPSVEQMFAGLPTSQQVHVAANGAVVTAPGSLVKPPVAPPVKPPVAKILMKPGLASYQAHIDGGWTDDMLIAEGMATRTSF